MEYKMGRLHLFEIEDQSWCPNTIRIGITEFLADVSRMTKLWSPTSSILRKLLEETSQKKLVVMGAGSGGGVLDVAPHLPEGTEILLTDLYPRLDFQNENPNIKYITRPIDASAVPKELTGVRVMYASFHHCRPELAKKIMGDAVKERQAIAIFEGTERSFKGIVSVFFVPFIVLLVTPFIRPFRLSRLILTYVLPILPLVIFWDGLVSALRTYSLSEMQKLTAHFPDYDWTVEILKGPRGESIPSLTGKPKVMGVVE